MICCRPDRAAAEADPTVRLALARCRSLEVTFVGRRPGKEIDPLLTGRLLVIGEDTDLAAVVLRLMRTERLASVIVAYATDVSTAVTDLWSLPLGGAAVDLALGGDPDLVPIVRTPKGTFISGAGLRSTDDGKTWKDIEKFPNLKEQGWRHEGTLRRMLGPRARSST